MTLHKLSQNIIKALIVGLPFFIAFVYFMDGTHAALTTGSLSISCVCFLWFMERMYNLLVGAW